MPFNANPDPALSKKRKVKETVFHGDGRDSGFTCHDSNEELRLKRGHAHSNRKEKPLQTFILQESVQEPTGQNAKALSSNPSTEMSLKMHMESVISEVNEAREKLFRWWQQEIQAIFDVACPRRGSDANPIQTNKPTDCANIRDLVSAKAVHARDKSNPDSEKLVPVKPLAVVNACKGYVHTCMEDTRKASEFFSVNQKPIVVDTTLESATSKDLTDLDQGNSTNKPGQKINSLIHNVMSKLPPDSKSPLFESCLGAELADDSRDVEALDATLESGVTVREGFASTKVSHGIQKTMDGLERLRETKSSLFDMGFDDEESNEGNGVGCSLESAASSKVNSGFCKESIGMSNAYQKGYDAGFANGLDEQGGDDLCLNGGPESSAGGADVFVSVKARKEMISDEGKHGVVKDKPVNHIGEGRLDNESRQVDTLVRSKPGPPLLKSSLVGAGLPAQVNQPKAAMQQLDIRPSSDCGIQPTHLAGMTFKGSVLECKPDLFQNANASFADTFNSNVLVAKHSVQLPTRDKCRAESLALPRASDGFGLTGIGMSTGNILTTSKAAVAETIQDPKAVQLEYTSRSWLGDGILGSGKTVDYPGFDPMVGFHSQLKAGPEMVDVYQQERAVANMYFSSLCTNNSVYLPTSNRVLSVQCTSPSSSPSSAPVSRPMLMGIPSHLGGYRGHGDPSNMHSFLGLGMNGASAVGNGMQGLSGLYLQNNQQHSPGTFKHILQPAASVIQENSAAQEKAIIELNF